MTGGQNVSLNVTLTGAGEAAIRCWYLGWRDYFAGRVYPFGYDRWVKEQQINYEVGRLTAANVHALGVDPPAWNGTRNGVGAISRLADRADRRLGPAIP